ncbi:MAG: T9SS type A sorting domain-containing protein [Saprospiraceae bacterium]|nr:T9SS type A sorting domain-containing protein [Saprospiraceae bacterium]
MKYIITVLTLCTALCQSLGQSCDVDGILHSSFIDVQLVLDANQCGSCHKGQNNKGNWNYDSYNSFLKKGDCGFEMIVHGDASNSFFFRKILGVNTDCGESNEGVHTLPQSDVGQIESWINFGAPELCVPLYADVKQILDNNGCNSCHGNDPGEWRYDSYLSLLNGEMDSSCSDYDVIVKGNSSQSLLFDKINNDGAVSCGDAMNASNGPMDAMEVAKIRDWINSGAYETAASLPVILSRFSLKDDNGDVHLAWSTEEEIATEKFVVERSTSGQNFQEISELKSEGSATEGYNYEYLDRDPFIGENYYRLKILDLDGSYKYSNIRLIRMKSEETTILVYPNPAVSRERLTVRWLPRADEESTYLNIVDVNGQNLHRKIIFEGTNYVRLPYLLDGVYYIIVEDLFGGFLLERVVIIN